ncbi:hypothetical protein PoB_000944000 [Plakobranchus ocellatus]|uniref:Uncharacterized protein n=1 Tax=Plakobranchus ocellatus TaxID=259542 RepID=A0AAV3YJM2_9GAST|nr:hypothetical protein PoB_000944000 [Plakobranchus ocellatus]
MSELDLYARYLDKPGDDLAAWVEDKPQADEDFGTFINRAKRYFDGWIELSAMSILEGLSYLICSEIALQACDEDFVAYVKDRSSSDMVSL